MSIRPVAEDVFQLPLMPRDAINAYLLGDVLVDTGIKQSAGKIAGMLNGREVSAIALTHAHADHAGGMKRLAAQLGVPVWCGAVDREAVETGNPVLSPGLQRPGLSTIAAAAGAFDGVHVDRVLREGDALAAGFIVLDTPGHSPGHVSFWRESDRTLICGDVFFNMSLLTTVPGLREPPGLLTTDPAKNRDSERRLAELEPTAVGFGHGPVLSRDAARELRDFVATSHAR
ncbi:MAG TPA: MBL fold metallo-hydrolase [Solirubrobacteraceae bacterium]|jgi:glyoxylase-like metal-dependent hydrolase (beta-lactamase superfamily II)|nr:MBL fold metallo-hydrolase [Solirubrobacteraceae bacterium]